MGLDVHTKVTEQSRAAMDLATVALSTLEAWGWLRNSGPSDPQTFLSHSHSPSLALRYGTGDLLPLQSPHPPVGRVRPRTGRPWGVFLETFWGCYLVRCRYSTNQYLTNPRASSAVGRYVPTLQIDTSNTYLQCSERLHARRHPFLERKKKNL